MSPSTDLSTPLTTGTADLHMHTTASDGTIDIDQRIDIAADTDLEAIAITDHDVIADHFTTGSTVERGVEVITGVEVRASEIETKVEILGYFVDPTNEQLKSMLERVRRFRRTRNERLVENVARETDLDISYEELSHSVTGNIGRPHIANRLVEAGFVDTVQAAFDDYLAPTGDAFVPMERLSADWVIATIHAAGGVASLAHPGRIRTEVPKVEAIVESLAAVGLDGIESWYPYSDQRESSYAEIGVEDALVLAERFDLVPTGGSDCHGPGSGKFRQGEVRVPSNTLEQLRASRPAETVCEGID